MIYDPFNFSSNPALKQLPTSSITGPKGTTFGYGGRPQVTNYGFGQSSTFQPNLQDLQASQKSEFQRLGGIQELETGALQQQQAGLQLRQSQMELADLEEQRRIRSIIDKGPPMTSGPVSPYGNSWDQAINSTYGRQYQLEKEKTQYELNMMRRMGQGGFGSWSVPSFPSMG